MKARMANGEWRMPTRSVVGREGNSSFEIRHSKFTRAFTLIELMVVVGIIGLILAMGAPTLLKFFHKEGFRKSVSDTLEACSTARARAILSQTTVELMFHPVQKRCEVSGGPGGGWGGWAATASFGDSVMIEMLDVNLIERKSDETAGVRFFPNGTSDEMTLLLRSDQNKQCGITLEITTGLATFLNEEGVQKLIAGKL